MLEESAGVGTATAAPSFTETFTTTVYEDMAQTTAEWSTADDEMLVYSLKKPTAARSCI